MEEVKQDVVADPSPAPVESSNEVQEVAQPEKQEVVETPAETPAPEVRQPLAEVDEMGVPYKNRYMEAQRKLQKLEETVNQIQQKQQQPEQKYTAEQLRVFAASTDDPQSRMWALNELDKVSKDEMSKVVSQKFEEFNRKTQEEHTRQQAFQAVIQRNPDLAVKDENGNFVGFNEKSPLFARMNFYMSNPRVSSQPDALEIAEAYAMRDLAHAQKPNVQATIAKQATQIKSLQKKTMVEGGGNNSNISVSPRQAALEKAKQTGTIKDAAEAMGSILRDSGLMSD